MESTLLSGTRMETQQRAQVGVSKHTGLQMFCKSCCRGVLNNICATHLSPAPVSFFRLCFHFALCQHFCSPSSISAVCWGSEPGPPFPPSLSSPPTPVSQLVLVSVMEHIWERLSLYSPSAEVWLKAEGCSLLRDRREGPVYFW